MNHVIINIFFQLFFFLRGILTESISQKIDRILDDSLNKDNDLYNLSLTKALLVGTLHSDENLTSSIFGLLQKHVSYESGIATLSEEVILVPTIAVSQFVI